MPQFFFFETRGSILRSHLSSGKRCSARGRWAKGRKIRSRINKWKGKATLLYVRGYCSFSWCNLSGLRITCSSRLLLTARLFITVSSNVGVAAAIIKYSQLHQNYFERSLRLLFAPDCVLIWTKSELWGGDLLLFLWLPNIILGHTNIWRPNCKKRTPRKNVESALDPSSYRPLFVYQTHWPRPSTSYVDHQYLKYYLRIRNTSNGYLVVNHSHWPHSLIRDRFRIDESTEESDKNTICPMPMVVKQ